MKRVKYSKYIPNLAEELSLDDLMDALADFLLESGFESELGQYYRPGNSSDELDALREAIRDALLNSGEFDEEMREHLQQMQNQGQMDDLIDEVDGPHAAGRLRDHLSAARSGAHLQHRRQRGTRPTAPGR